MTIIKTERFEKVFNKFASSKKINEGIFVDRKYKWGVLTYEKIWRKRIKFSIAYGKYY